MFEMNSGTKVFDALKSRYRNLSRPPSDAGRLDNHGGHVRQLWVFGNRKLDDDDDDHHHHDRQSPSTGSFSKPMFDLNIIDQPTIKEKIISALSALRFQGQHVLVQFWSPVLVRNCWSLTALDQPFALGVVDDKGLYSYRLYSEQRMFVLDEKHAEELGPPARVYRQKLSELSFDRQTSPTKQSVQDFAASNNIYGYLLLPVCESNSGCCVGVLELVKSSSNYADYASEVQEVSRAFKEENLKSPNDFEDPTINVSDERRRYEPDEIHIPVKTVCDSHKLPLAQTWSLAGNSSFVANSSKLDQSCSSFKNIENEPSNFGAVGTSHGVVRYSEEGKGIPRRKRKRAESSISLDEIKKHFRKPFSEAAAELGVSRSTLKHICRGFGLARWPFMNRDSLPSPITFLTARPPESGNQQPLVENERNNTIRGGEVPYFPVGIKDTSINKGETGRNFNEKSKMKKASVGLEIINDSEKELHDMIHATKSEIKHIRESLGIPRLREEYAQPETYITEEYAQPEEYAEPEDYAPPEEYAEAEITVKASYMENMVRFPFRLSEGLVKLEELVGMRFELRHGSFKLKYIDAGDMIWISCDRALRESVSGFRRPDGRIVMRLLVKW